MGFATSVVNFPTDLRGTTCKPWRHPNLPFKPSSNKSLYHPADLTVALDRLTDTVKTPQKTPLFSHPAPFIINIDALYHKPSKFNPATHPLNDLYRDIDSEDEELSEPTPPLGRREVFVPYGPPRQAPSCSTTAHESPQHTYPGLSEASDQMYKPREYPRSNLIHDCECSEECECGCRSACYGGCDYVCPEHGGLFAPSDMDHDGWGEGLARRTPSLEPDPGDDRDSSAWLDDTADYERRAFAREYGADKFYTEHAPRHAVAAYDRSGGRPRDPHGAMSTSGAGERTDPLMLFRTPPPWSVLPSAPPAKPAPSVPSGTGLRGSTSSIPAPADDNGAKRKRTEHDDVAPADQARRRMHALSSIQSMLSLVQKRADKPADGDVRQVSGARVTMPGRVNPFARAAQAGRTGVKRKIAETSLEEGPLQSTPASTLSAKTPDSMPELSPAAGGSTTRLARPTATPLAPPAKPAQSQRKPRSPPRPQARPPSRPQPGPSSSSALSGRQSDGTAPSTSASERKPKAPRPPKKLKPITTLRVPDWPIEFRPLSHYKPKPPPAPPRKPSVQTTLPVSRGPARVAVAPGSASKSPPDKEAKEKRRVSAPVVLTRRINMVVETPGKGGTGQVETGASNTGKRVKGKERKGEGFDWKKWGTG
ncbi:hypothetical protein BD413DRAFT_17265 [Trametes elegans]|nr:hypothetical protein BD413DRAFT_17265 [Trametes elegans]